MIAMQYRSSYLAQPNDNWFFLQVILLSRRDVDGIRAEDGLHVSSMHGDLLRENVSSCQSGIFRTQTRQIQSVIHGRGITDALQLCA